MRKDVLLIIGLILLISLANAEAKDVAYIVKNNINQDFINTINNLGLSYDIINSNNAASTDFSQYNLILVGNEIFNNPNEIPVADYNSLIINKYHIKEWGLSDKDPSIMASSQILSIKNIDNNNYITNGLNDFLQAYTSCCYGNGLNLPLYYLSRLDRVTRLYVVSSTLNNNLDSVVAVSLPGTRLLNNKVSAGRILFFGITESSFWTNDVKELFKRSLAFTLNGNDFDRDGFGDVLVGGNDCNDNDATIYPGASEVSYDGIDQDCDGKDLTDVDNDGFDSELVNGLDCNDNDANVNPNALELLDNIDQNCKNDNPLFIQQIPDIEWDEDTIYNLDLNDYFKDPDGDILIYSVNGNTNINIDILNSVATLTPSNNFFGEETIIFSANDNEFNTDSNDVVLKVNNVNNVPLLINNIPDINFDEDTTYNLDLNDYFKDPDGDILIYSVNGNLNINIDILNGIATLTPDNNFFGQENIIFSASDGQENIDSNSVLITINNVDDEIILVNNIPDIELDEDTTYTLDLNDYFVDLDKEGLEFSFSENNNINVLIDNNGIVSFIPENNWYGNDEIIFYANDGNSILESNLVNLIVKNANDKPEILSVSIFDGNDEAVEVFEDHSYLIKAETFDIDNDELIYNWYLDDNLISSEKEFSYEFNFNDQGNRNLKLIVKDLEGEISEEIELFVNNVNRKPQILVNNNFEINEDEEITIELIASDDDNEELEFSVESGENINCKITDKLIAEPFLNFFGEDKCILSVSDGNDIVILEINFNVNAVNDKPEILGYSPDEELRVRKNEILDFNLDIKDADNDQLNYRWYVNDNLISSEKEFSYEFNNIGLNIVKVLVDDNLDSIENLWFVNVVDNVNDDEFDGETTDFFNVDLNNINNLILEKSRFGKILFLETVSLGENKDLNNNVIIKDNIAAINSNEIPELNKKARITMVKQSYKNEPLIFKSDIFTDDASLINEICQDCKLVSFTPWPTNNGVVIFQVNGFSSYAVKEGKKESTNNNSDFCSKGEKGDIRLKLIKPENSDEISINDGLIVELDVKNGDDAVAEFFLRNKDGKLVLDEKEEIKEEKNEFNLEIDDLDEGEYNLFVKVYEDDNEENNCKQKSTNIKIEREEVDIRVKSFLIEPNTLSCNGKAVVEINLENLGRKEEELDVRLFNEELNIDLEANNLYLNKFNKNNNKAKVLFNIEVPDNLEKDTYDLNLEVNYKDKITRTKQIKINECSAVNNFNNNLFLLQDKAIVNNDGRFVIPLEINNNENRERNFVIEIVDESLENKNENVNLMPLQKKVVYLESRVHGNLNGAISSVINLKENNKIIESKAVKLENFKNEKEESNISLIIGNILVFLIIICLIFIFL